MNIIRTSLLIFNCALLITSCSSDFQSAADQLPSGKYPLELRAANIVVNQSRATADNSWAGGEEVGLTVSGDTTVYKYVADAEGNLTSQKPYYWQTTDDIKVTAWYPYNDGVDPDTAWTVKQDQSADGYQSSDYIKADTTTVTFAGDKALTFTHQTSKIIVTLEPGDGFTADDLAEAVIQVYDGTRYITTHSGSALIVPTTIESATEFISIAIADAEYVYALDEPKTFSPATSYTFALTVSKSGIELEGCTIGEWNSIVDKTAHATTYFATINVETAGTLKENEDIVTAAIAAGGGNVIVTGKINQNDLDVILAKGEEFVSLDMSGASGEDLKINVSAFSNVKFSEEVEATANENQTRSGTSVSAGGDGTIDTTDGTTWTGGNDGTTTGTSVTVDGDGSTSIVVAKINYNENLQSIKFPKGVTEIKTLAFYACSKLTSITIPSSVTTIAVCAFSDCIALTSVTVEATTPPTLGANAFYECNKLQTIYVPTSSVETYQEKWSDYSSKIKAKK